jgi:primosomal protein N' (replication factor Y)
MYKFVSVALDVPVNKLFDYRCTHVNAKVGSRVVVPFGRSIRIGIIVKFFDNVDRKGSYEIKDIQELLDHTPTLSSELLKTSRWASNYYHYPLGQVLFSALTPIKRKNKPEPKSKYEHSEILKPDSLVLNDEQFKVAKSINKNINKYQVNYIQGVTGSGKTEIYTYLTSSLLEENAQVLILVPEINLTPQTVARFQKYMTTKPIEYHSHLTPTQKFRVCQACREEEKLVVIGTRSAVFLPFKNLKLIVVDEEHDQSYKQNEKFKYNARDISIVRAKNFNCPVILGSATPSFESLHNINIKKYKQYKLLNRFHKSKMPLITIVDTSVDKPDEGLSKTLKDKMKSELGKNKKIILFIGRRGFSNTVLCSECKTIVKCPKCNTIMTYHKNVERLICHQCEFSQNFESVKTCCENPSLVPLGVGTQRLENKVKELFPNKRVLRIDSDNISSKKDLTSFIESATNNKIDIFVGTQMIVKGHDFPNISLVGIINIDAGLYSTDFRGLEKTGQLITQVSGRAGRQKSQGNVIIQTNNPKHSLLLKILKEGYEEFSKVALKERESVNLPPYSHIGIINISAANRFKPKSLLAEIVKFKKNKSVFVYGPSPAETFKKNNTYSYQIIVGSKSHKLLSEHITRIKLYLASIDSKIKWYIDIDPTQ